MTTTTNSKQLEKRDRFARLFPARIDKIRDGLRIAGNCANPSHYAWDESKIQLLFGLLLKEFISTARLFGITVDATVNGTNIDDLPD